MLPPDIGQVALPIRELSEVLTDADLFGLTRTAKVDRQMAIARLREVSGAVADALVATENERVVTELVGNDRADLSETALVRVVERFGGVDNIQGAMVHR